MTADPRRRADSARQVVVAGRALPLRVRRHRAARQMTLRVDHAEDALLLTLPRWAPIDEGLAFVEERAGWIATQLAQRPPFVALADGAVVPYLGVDHVIHHRPEQRGGVWREDGAIVASGRAEHLPRRLRDWFRAEARREIAARARAKAEIAERPVARVTVRDTASRWGSCTADGVLNFSWRLIFAPEFVLDYVVAHEVAHLRHMNHGVRFWRLVERLAAERAAATRWLHRHGQTLHRYR